MDLNKIEKMSVSDVASADVICSKAQTSIKENTTYNLKTESMFSRDLSTDFSSADLLSAELFKKPGGNDILSNQNRNLMLARGPTSSEIIKSQTMSFKADLQREASKMSTDFDNMINSLRGLTPTAEDTNQEKKRKSKKLKTKALPPVKTNAHQTPNEAHEFLLLKYSNDLDHGSDFSIALPTSTRIQSLQNSDVPSQKEKSKLSVIFKFIQFLSFF